MQILWVFAAVISPVWADDVGQAGRGSSPTVILDPLSVVAEGRYAPIEKRWQIGQVNSFRALSHDVTSARRLVGRLQEVREGMDLLWNVKAAPIQVIICENAQEMATWSGLGDDAVDRVTRFVRTAAGPVLVVNSEVAGVEQAVGRAYVRAILESATMPLWLREGLAQVLNSVEINGDRMRVGQVQINEVANFDDRALRELEAVALQVPIGERLLGAARVAPDDRSVQRIMTSSGSRLFNPIEFPTSGGGDLDGGIPITLNGHQATWQEVLDYCGQELRRRGESKFTYQPDQDFFTYFRSNAIPSLRQLFDANAPDEVRWRMGAWAITHYCLFSKDKKAKPSLTKFLGMLREQPSRSPIELFKEAFGVSAGKFETWLSAYAAAANYQVPIYRITDSATLEEIEMKAASESPILQYKAAVFLATQRAAEARALLLRGYVSPANRTPSYVRLLAELELREDPKNASRILDAAQQRAPLEPRDQRLLGHARLEGWIRENPGRQLPPEELHRVLEPLFVALNGDDQAEELFLLIGRAWSLSSVPPRDEHLNALRMGLKYYPKSEGIAQLLAKLEASKG